MGRWAMAMRLCCPLCGAEDAENESLSEILWEQGTEIRAANWSCLGCNASVLVTATREFLPPIPP